MITYVIEPRLVPLVRSGRVVQLIRSAPVRCASRGDRIGLMDSRTNMVIPDPLCIATYACQIDWSGRHIARLRQGGIPVRNLDGLARACGYDCSEDLSARLLRVAGAPPPAAFIVEWLAPEIMMVEMA